MSCSEAQPQLRRHKNGGMRDLNAEGVMGGFYFVSMALKNGEMASGLGRDYVSWADECDVLYLAGHQVLSFVLDVVEG